MKAWMRTLLASSIVGLSWQANDGAYHAEGHDTFHTQNDKRNDAWPETYRVHSPLPDESPCDLACAATIVGEQASIFLDYSSAMKVMNISTNVAVDCACNNSANLKQQFWSAPPTADPLSASFIINCTQKAALCIVPEDGSPWVPTGEPPPDGIRIYPYWEPNLETFLYTLTDLVTGWLVAELVQSDGALINEATFYNVRRPYEYRGRPVEMPQKPPGYASSPHIKAVAVSCDGCETVRNHASFACTMPPIYATTVPPMANVTNEDKCDKPYISQNN